MKNNSYVFEAFILGILIVIAASNIDVNVIIEVGESNKVITTSEDN